jgi:uncharacterized protein YqeY
MKLIDRISEDIKAAMKGGAKVRLETLRSIRAALQEKVVERRPSGKEIGEEDELAVLNQASKKRKEAIEIYRTQKREDLAQTEEEELRVIQEYLPKQMSPAELDEVVRRAIASTGASTAKDFGKVMPLVMKEVKGKIDGRLAQETVKRMLPAN